MNKGGQRLEPKERNVQTMVVKISKVKVDVTQELIDTAVRNNSNRCMVQAAMQHTFPTATHVTVDIHTIRMTLPEDQKRYIYLTPGRVQQYIFDFDEGQKVEPFSFRLESPAWIADATSHGGGDKKEKAITSIDVRNSKNGGKHKRVEVETVLPVEPNPRMTGRRVKGLRAVRGWDVNPDFKPGKEAK